MGEARRHQMPLIMGERSCWDSLVVVLHTIATVNDTLHVTLQLPEPRSHGQSSRHRRVLRHSPPVRILVIAKSVNLIGVRLGHAQRGVVDRTWQGFLMALLGREVVVWMIPRGLPSCRVIVLDSRDVVKPRSDGRGFIQVLDPSRFCHLSSFDGRCSWTAEGGFQRVISVILDVGRVRLVSGEQPLGDPTHGLGSDDVVRDSPGILLSL